MRTGLRDWLSGQLSAPALTLLLVMGSISLLTLAWTMAEADDRRTESCAALTGGINPAGIDRQNRSRLRR